MKCHDARSAMLEVPTRVLRGEGQGDLADHIAGCPECASTAGEMAELEVQLHGSLDAMGASHDVEVTLGAVHTRLANGEGRALRVSSVRWRRVAPILAAAAAVAALALWRDDTVERAPPAPRRVDVVRLVTSTQRQRDAPPAGEVGVDADQRFALMKTDKPTISVVWFY